MINSTSDGSWIWPTRWSPIRDVCGLVARVDVPVEPGTASANTTNLRSYVTTASGQDERFASLAALVNLEGSPRR